MASITIRNLDEDENDDFELGPPKTAIPWSRKPETSYEPALTQTLLYLRI